MTAIWLAWRDLVSRRAGLALAAGVVAAGVALLVAIELLSRAREESLATQVGQAAPQLKLVPAGVTSSALDRLELGDRLLPAGTAERARRLLAGTAGAVEEALIVEEQVGGTPVPVIGVGRDRMALGPAEAAAGALLAERSGAAAGADVEVAGRTYRIVAVLAPHASAEDLALFLPLESLRATRAAPDATSELRVRLRAGASAEGAVDQLRAAFPGAHVIRVDRGQVADRELQGALAQHRHLVYAVTALVVMACLLLAAHLDASERRLELATLIAVGATAGLVTGALALRSAVVGAIGGVTGALAGLAVAWTLGAPPGSAALLLLATAVLTATVLAAVAGLPTALLCGWRSPVADLQEAAS